MHTLIMNLRLLFLNNGVFFTDWQKSNAWFELLPDCHLRGELELVQKAMSWAPEARIRIVLIISHHGINVAKNVIEML